MRELASARDIEFDKMFIYFICQHIMGWCCAHFHFLIADISALI